MAPERSTSEHTQEKGKGKAPSTSTGGAARPRAKRTPTVAEMWTETMRRIEATRRETLAKLKSLEDVIMDVVTNQLLQADETLAIREKLEAFQRQSTESPIEHSGKRCAEVAAETLEQESRGAANFQPVPQKRVKVAVSKKPVYSKPERVPPEPTVQEKKQPEMPAAPEIPIAPENPPPIIEKPVPSVPNLPSPTPEAPTPEPMPARAQLQQSVPGKASKCTKCNFFHRGMCTMQPNTCFRCMQSGHLARDCQFETVCNICKMPGHLAKGCLRGRNGKKN